MNDKAETRFFAFLLICRMRVYQNDIFYFMESYSSLVYVNERLKRDFLHFYQYVEWDFIKMTSLFSL